MRIFYKLKQIIEKPWWSFAGFALACFMLFGLTGTDLWSFLVNFEWAINATKWSLIGGAFIFGLSAYMKAKQLIIDLSEFQNKLESKVKPQNSKFPISDWLTGEDLMRYYDLSHDQLMQHIRNGLNVYPAGNDVLVIGDEVPPLKQDDLVFEIENEDYSNYRFKKSDIEEFIKKKPT